MAQSENLREKPIPAFNPDLTAQSYSKIPIQLDHALNREPLVEASTSHISALSYYAREDKCNPPYYEKIDHSLREVWLRQTAMQKLTHVNAILKSYGVMLQLLDGYRSVELQQALWDFNMEEVQFLNPHFSKEECYRTVSEFLSDPRRFNREDFTTWPTHSTGGAIDLTLISIPNKEPLYMGSVFDDASEVSHTAFYERENSHGSLSHDEARHNRRLLFWAMIEAGFANYAYEWWHYDFGNQMWVMNRKSLFPNEKGLIAKYGWIPSP